VVRDMAGGTGQSRWTSLNFVLICEMGLVTLPTFQSGLGIMRDKVT
jgi:hypothetical protein